MLEQDLRPYQCTAVKNIRDAFKKSQEIPGTTFKNLKGAIIIPTGGGKTIVEAFVLRDFINMDGNNIHLVLAPRIMLLNQLIADYRNCIGQSYVALAFHSGNFEPDYQKVKWKEEATTSVDVLIDHHNRAKRLGKDLVVFSTYHSSEKLRGIKFDSIIADESQYCVSEGFYESVASIDSYVKLFFTATEKHTSTKNGRGLNNTDTYGEVLYQIPPKDLIDGGYIVPPRLHVMYGSIKEGSRTEVDEAIKIAKFQHNETVKSMPHSKILFAMRGTEDVKNVVDNVEKIKKEMPGHEIFTIVSNEKYGAMVNGIKMSRGDFMEKLRVSGNSLIFHYDILSEGIDIDGITGIAVLRNLMHSKLLQTIGRAVRVYKANAELKKIAWITGSVFNNNDETKSFVAEKIKTMRDGGFDISVEEVIFTGEEGSGIVEGKQLEDQYGTSNRKKAQGLVMDIFHEIEEDERFLELDAMPLDKLIEGFR